MAFDGVGFAGFFGKPLRHEEVAHIAFPFFQAVGKVYAQTRWVGAGFVAQFGQYHVQFHVAHGVGGHEQLKAINTRQQILFDIARPHARRNIFDLGGDQLNHFGQKGPGAGSWVQNLYAMHFFLGDDVFAFFIRLARIPIDGNFGGVSQAFGEAKFGFKHVVDSADDKVDHGLWRVPNPPRFALGGVIGG